MSNVCSLTWLLFIEKGYENNCMCFYRAICLVIVQCVGEIVSNNQAKNGSRLLCVEYYGTLKKQNQKQKQNNNNRQCHKSVQDVKP